MSWAKWDLEHRSSGVRETQISGVSTKVTSGGKHLGNIHKEANGTHTAVTKVGGVLQSHNFQSHQGALNHIRKTHGLPGISAKKTAPSTPPPSKYDKAKAEAEEASKKANTSNTAEAHFNAVTAHGKAMDAAGPGTAQYYDHMSFQHEHLDKGKKLAAANTAKKVATPVAKKVAPPNPQPTLTDRVAAALNASAHANKVKTSEAHKAAEKAHLAASEKATSMGMGSVASSHLTAAMQHNAETKKLAVPAAKKTAPSAPAHAFASWDAEHGSGGGGVSSADKIAASIRGALGPGTLSAPKVESKTGKSGSTISRAESARSVVAHVQKKDMKRPAPVKGEKDQADAFRTKIRMAEYNRKKEAAKAADPVNALTPKTEVNLNPHTTAPKADDFPTAHANAAQAGKDAMKVNTVEAHQKAIAAQQKAIDLAPAGKSVAGYKGNIELHQKAINKLGGTAPAAKKTASPQSSADKIAAMIKGTHAEQHGKTAAPAKKVAAAAPKVETPAAPAPKHTVPELKEKTYAAGSAEDLANKAEEATRTANESPSYVNHQKAYEAHSAVLSKLSASDPGMHKARDYHTLMQGFHRFAADHPAKVVPAGLKEKHEDKLADRLPQAGTHQMHTAFTDTASRRHSQQMYEAVPKASESKLTPGQKSSIGAYTGSAYTTINTYHRQILQGKGHMTQSSQDAAKKHTANLDAAFAKQPALQHDLVTYRGTRNADEMFGKVGERVGGEFVDHGYTSTSSHAAVGGGFGGGISNASAAPSTLIRVLHPAGSKVLKPSEVGSFHDAEREILTPRGTRFHIAADRVVTLQNGKTQRQVDLIRK